MSVQPLGIGAVFFIALILSGCAGRTANPISVVQGKDNSLTCGELEAELVSLGSAARGLSKQADKLPKNAALLAAGAFLVVPYFFIDLSDAEEEELNAVRARHMRIKRIATDKEC
jgi:hypothetical protein